MENERMYIYAALLTLLGFGIITLLIFLADRERARYHIKCFFIGVAAYLAFQYFIERIIGTIS